MIVVSPRQSEAETAIYNSSKEEKEPVFFVALQHFLHHFCKKKHLKDKLDISCGKAGMTFMSLSDDFVKFP